MGGGDIRRLPFLYPGTAPGSTQESREHGSRRQRDQAEPNSFQAFSRVEKRHRSVICPGGGFMALVFTEHGTEVAKYMTARGVTSFVLKYRLVQGLALLEQRKLLHGGALDGGWFK